MGSEMCIRDSNQPPPPIARGLQFYSLRVGPRLNCSLYIAGAQLRAFVDTEYEHVGVISNALIRYTGNEKNFNALGVGGGFFWIPRNFLVLGVRASYASLLSLDGGLSSISLQLGLLGDL